MDARDRFHPHIAVHELEAWIFADDQALFNWLGHRVGPFPNTEAINIQNPPAKQLRDLTRHYARHKVAQKRLMSQRLFAQIDVEKVYSKCPHFKGFVDNLQQTARR